MPSKVMFINCFSLACYHLTMDQRKDAESINIFFTAKPIHLGRQFAQSRKHESSISTKWAAEMPKESGQGTMSPLHTWPFPEQPEYAINTNAAVAAALAISFRSVFLKQISCSYSLFYLHWREVLEDMNWVSSDWTELGEVLQGDT